MSSTPRPGSNDGSSEAPPPRVDSSPTPELDVKKLQALPSEQQDLYLLTFVSTLTKHVESLDADGCTAQQLYLKKELMQILSLSAPPPTRVIRNNLGKCFAHILGKGDRKLLFETVNDLTNIISSGKAKTESDLRTKHAAVFCLGDVYEAAGDSVIGLHPLVCSALLKLLKPAGNSAGLRAAIFKSLGKIVKMIEGSIDDSIARDVWKQARNHASSDKSALVQTSVCRCLKLFAKHTYYFDNPSDFENLKSTIFKTIDSSSPLVRQAAGEALAEALCKNHSEDPVQDNDIPKIKKPKRTNTSKRMSMAPGADDDELPTRPESPGPKKSQILVFTLPEMLKQLSTFYVKMSTSNRARAGIAVCYTRIFKSLSERNVETMYLKIVDHLTIDILSNSTITSNRYRLLTTRRFVQVILEDVIGQTILGESGQLDAAKRLINDVLKNYPQVIKERPEPSKHALIAVLSALASLINTVGSAATAFADSCRDALVQVLQHPSYTVQVYTSYCLRTFMLACPQQLLPCLTICMNSVNRELNLLTTGRNSPRRCIGFANGLSAMISTAPLQPLYGSVDVNSRVLSLATGLLKSSSKSELRISSTQIQVAWILIGGLMSLGPNFVKIHLSQLLLLWKNALPKPLAKDNTSQRSYLESSFLTHVRECALGSILAFLQFNSRLLTVDVSKRIAAMLQNTSAFLKSLPPKKTMEDITQRLTPSLQLQDLDLMVQRRVLQCYTKLVNLSPAGGSEALIQSNILTLAISFFADPDNYTPSSLSTSIANSAGTFETVWDVGDNCGFGVTGLVRGFKVKPLPGQHDNEPHDDWMKENGPDNAIANVLLSPICSSLEHDSLALYLGDLGNSDTMPDPPATEVVNVAIKLFAIAFPLTPPKIQESILEQVATFMSAGSLQRDPGRKAAMNVNVAAALFSTLKVAVKETQSPAGDLTNTSVEKLMQEMIRTFVIHQDQYVRSIGYEAIARLCNSSGNSFTNTEIKYLIDTIVGNREPSARAGCAMALGSIHAQVGSMAAGFHLKTILGILMSLGNDPHPTVHFWALEALAGVADSAGLNFSGYVTSTLGMIGQLYVGDTHNEDVSSVANSNLELELSTTAVFARCVDSLVNVLGPDLQDMSKPRELILNLVGQFQEEEDPLVLGGSLRCLEHLSLYAPGHVPFADYVVLLQKDLNSEYPELRDIAIDGLHNLMKRNSEDVVKVAEDGFEDQLWLALDSDPTHEGIRNVILNWLRQSCLTETARWLQRCQTVLSMTRPKAAETFTASAKQSAMPDLQDEEVAGFAAASGAAKDDGAAAAGSGQEPLRWQVRRFAMSCLGEMFALITKATPPDADGTSLAEMALQKRVADVIRMAFSASTSNVVELRVWGLKIIDSVLKMFGKTPDPDFAEAPLLEQYQAQISSALTPAFAADSSPELASEAVNVCAQFIATGIVTDIDRMGRILKTLVTALENFSTEAEVQSIGDLKGLSSNAQVMVKMAVFSAWAELQVASTEQRYLVDVLKPYIGTLTPLWLASLREFARLRFEPDISMSLGPPSLSGSLDSIYSALNRETLLRFYQESWLKLVDAIASLIEQDSEFVFDALDGKETDGPQTNGHSKGNDINYRDEPVAFFFVLFGIAFEALVARPGSDALASKEQTLEILQALKKILHPSVSGHAIYREAIFSETMDLLDRLVLTEGLDVQGVIVQIARGLCISHPSATKGQQAEDGDLSEDIEQLFELTRIIVLVLAGLLPNLTEARQPARHQLTDEAVSLVRVSLNALVDAAEVFPSIIKTDLHACIIHIFATILGTPSCQAVVVPQSLPIMKRFVASISTSKKTTAKPDSDAVQIQGCLKRFLSIYLNAQKRETEASLPCVKNTLLATTVLLTSGQNFMSASEPLVSRFLDEVIDCLSDRMTAKVAAGCIRTLLLQSPKTLADQSIARYLLPRLVKFATHTKNEDPENARALVMHALTTFVATLPGPQKTTAMSLLVPCLLARANSEGEAVYKETSARLLDLAGNDQTAFRGVVGGMTDKQKAFMESVILAGRQAQGVKVQDDEGQGQEPTIALRMDFGA
ncbi:related to rat omega-conotoxin-sensitive calcium channel alpha-1 subunit rbB-I [Phialocephala subalpina]|uniref:Related to rat omega-conotoxin-sensitive calcium channel alpha-1 subunit rbB-I n=1 Tax=Phialocephala subalpina TaxID=576137 RepID=A0A1L7X1Z2_9HELO|nr:related to rat omega-conotoxin-sensitive calcium channel alpha-1 subunit rbB-I [Phialocephala subalpina]